MSGALHDAAWAYAQRGWSVFPVAVGGKAPLIPGGRGYDDATTDPDQIDRWWTRWPNANIGLPCRPNGFVVVDVDQRNGGDDTIIGLQRDAGEGLNPRLIAETPGGWHFYYTDPGGQLAGKLGQGVDIKVDGYVVAPPSSRPEGDYTWVTQEPPRNMPRWLLNAARPPRTRPRPPRAPSAPIPDDRYASAALQRETQTVAAAQPGDRNNTLNIAAFSLGQLAAAEMLTTDTIIEHLTVAAAECGLGHREAARTIGSGLKAGMRHPRVIHR